jgi:hypothetical protein
VLPPHEAGPAGRGARQRRDLRDDPEPGEAGGAGLADGGVVEGPHVRRAQRVRVEEGIADGVEPQRPAGDHAVEGAEGLAGRAEVVRDAVPQAEQPLTPSHPHGQVALCGVHERRRVVVHPADVVGVRQRVLCVEHT